MAVDDYGEEGCPGCERLKAERDRVMRALEDDGMPTHPLHERVDHVVTALRAYQDDRVLFSERDSLAADNERLREALAEVRGLIGRIESGEEAEYVDGCEGSEGCYEYTFDDGQRFVLDRLRALLSKGAPDG
jgi:hypothetical protein